jgi:AcrR family transcriptional regulator
MPVSSSIDADPRTNAISGEPISAGEPSTGSSGTSAETRERLLDAAERLFAERGFEGTSMRAITKAAGTSVSAANYHFGSKEKLLHETLRRATSPANERRIALLDLYQAEAGDTPLPLERVLDAFLRPVMEWRGREGVEGARQISARLFSDPPELIQSIKVEIFGPMSQRFVEALGRALPDHPPADVELAYQFLIAIMVYVISGQLESSSWGARHAEGTHEEDLLRHMIQFAAAGLRAAHPTM